MRHWGTLKEEKGITSITCSCGWKRWRAGYAAGWCWSIFYDHRHEATTGRNRYTDERAMAEIFEGGRS